MLSLNPLLWWITAKLMSRSFRSPWHHRWRNIWMSLDGIVRNQLPSSRWRHEGVVAPVMYPFGWRCYGCCPYVNWCDTTRDAEYGGSVLAGSVSRYRRKRGTYVLLFSINLIYASSWQQHCSCQMITMWLCFCFGCSVSRLYTRSQEMFILVGVHDSHRHAWTHTNDRMKARAHTRTLV